MNIYDNRWALLRAVEADLLSPPPEDPFQSFADGWARASNFDEVLLKREIHLDQVNSPPSPEVQRRAMRRSPAPRANRIQPMRERVLRQLNVSNSGRRSRSPRRQEVRPDPYNAENARPDEVALPEPRRRQLSPTQLPGVRAIPKNYNRFFRGLLTPGEYFAKSQTRYLGPFEEMPTVRTLPENDDYIILQRMGRLPDSGKSIFRQVGNLST